MNLKVITLNGQYIDVLSSDADVAAWAEEWIQGRDEYWDMEMYVDKEIFVYDDSISFHGENGMFALDIIHKSL